MILQDLKFALRLLIKDLGFTMTTVATLGLCLAGNTAIFSIINSVVLKPLPFPEPERIVSIGNAYPRVTTVRGYSGVPDYFDRLKETTAFEEISLHRTLPMNVAASETSPVERLTALQGTPSFFRVLRATAARGRLVAAEDGEVGQERKVILGYGLWQHLFGGRDEAVGALIRINAVPHTVVGILPQGFRFVDPDVQLWTPAAFTAEDRADNRRHANSWQMLARLKPGATQAQAQSQIDGLNARNEERYPQFKRLIAKSGFRTTVPDRLPIFGRTETPGVCIATGLGSRGLLWGPLGAELLACELEGEPLPLGRDHAGAVSPRRFLS